MTNTFCKLIDSWLIKMKEMPEVPDVAILHCGMMPHMKMGINVGGQS